MFFDFPGKNVEMETSLLWSRLGLKRQTFFIPALNFWQCDETSTKWVSDCIIYFLKVRLFVSTGMIFSINVYIGNLELCERTRNKCQRFWLIQHIPDCATLQKCFEIVLTAYITAYFSVTTGWLILFSKKTLNWKLQTYSVGWAWSIRNFDSCIGISRMGKVQKVCFWLIYLVSQSQTCLPPQACFFRHIPNWKLQSCVGEQRREIKCFDWFIKIQIMRKSQ